MTKNRPDVQIDLIKEAASMINTIGTQHEACKDWAWVRGMLRHHLPIFCERIIQIDPEFRPEKLLTEQACEAIGAFLGEAVNAYVDVSPILAGLEIAGYDFDLTSWSLI